MDAWAILHALWLFLPVYVANMSPVFTAKIVPGWSTPIDGGRMHRDGQRVLGDGKTWRGLVGGGVAAGLTAIAVAALAPHWGIMEGWDYGLRPYQTGTPIGTPRDGCADAAGSCRVTDVPYPMVFLFGFVAGFVALIGDAFESFLKRRRGKERGAPWIPFDQLDFVVFGLLGMLAAAPLLARGWLLEALFGDWIILVTLLVGTPVLHLLVNRIGYWLKLKEVPW